MATAPIYVGLDYSDQAVDAAVLDPQGNVLANRPVTTTADASMSSSASLRRQRGLAWSCGTGEANLLDELATRFGWSIDVAQPGFVSRMNQNPTKSDFKDAQWLADLVRGNRERIFSEGLD